MADTLFRTCTSCILLLTFAASPCRAQPAATAGDGSTADTPELRALRATVDRQAKEILSLRAEITALRAGKPSPAASKPAAVPAPTVATQPAARPGQPQRVIFV